LWRNGNIFIILFFILFFHFSDIAVIFLACRDVTQGAELCRKGGKNGRLEWWKDGRMGRGADS